MEKWQLVDGLIAERIRVTVLSVPIDVAVRMSFSSLTARRACLIEVEAGGLVGVGESWINYPEWGYRERLATLCDGLARHVVGHDVSDPRRVQAAMKDATLSVARQWGAPGPIWQAISGVDLALWDLKGKAEGKSVAQLLCDSPRRGSVPTYASGIGPDRVESWCERALTEGFVAAKVKLGFDSETDRAVLRSARSVLGRDVSLLADVNQGWTLGQALAAVPMLEEHDLGWLEEPIAGDGLPQLEALAASTRIPLATGENVYGPSALREYTQSKAIDTIQPDLTKCGGITVAEEVARLAAAAGTAFAPHCYGSAVGIAASLQLAQAFPGISPIELDIRDNPLRTELLLEPLHLQGGELVIPQIPGLGINLNHEVLERYRICTEERSTNDY